MARPGLEVPHELCSIAFSILCSHLRPICAPGAPHRAAVCTTDCCDMGALAEAALGARHS